MPGPFLRPPDDAQVAYEFFAPFAHVPGKYEWCRIRSPTHGVFDVFILLGPSTSHPATVYVNGTLGAAFMAERYPECTTLRVPPGDLHLHESPDGALVTGTLRAATGPLRDVELRFRSRASDIPVQTPYGGEGSPVWGSRFTCWGVDLNVPAHADGHIHWTDGRKDVLRAVAAVVTRGSFGRLAPR